MAVTAAYRLAIDWHGDGIPAWDGAVDALGTMTVDDLGTMTVDELIALLSDENATSDLRLNPELFCGRGRDIAREYLPPIAGQLAFSLDNLDGKYSFSNPSSPLAGYVLPGRRVELEADYDGVTYPLFTGYLDTPTEQPYMTKALVHFSSLDGLAKLKAAKVSTAMYTGITTDVAVGHILDAAGWPAADRVLDTGRTTLARWWVDNVDAFTAIRDLMFTEGPGSIFYVDAEGRLVFEGRHYRLLTDRCVDSQATFRSSGTEPVFASDFQYEPGIGGVVNRCTVPVRAYASAASVSIWTAPGLPLTFGAGEVRTFTVSTTADGFSDAVVAVTASPSVVTSLSRTSGKTAVLTVTAPAGGSVVTALSVTATTWTISETQVSETIDTSLSQELYGPRSFPDEFVPKWIPTTQEATDYANAVCGRYQDPVPQVRIGISNGHEDRLLQALSRQISDRFHVIESTRAYVDDDFTIEAIVHQVRDGRNHVTHISGERASNQSWWVLGDAINGLLGESTVLGY